MRNVFLVAAAAILTAGATDRPALSGTWLLDAAHSDITDARIKSETLAINQKPESIEISEDFTDPGGKEKKTVISCSVDGQPCKTKSSGEQVMFWYNGPKLVMTEMRHGSDWVVERRFKTSEDGKSLTMEVSHLAPPGQKNETLAFTKQ